MSAVDVGSCVAAFSLHEGTELCDTLSTSTAVMCISELLPEKAMQQLLSVYLSAC